MRRALLVAVVACLGCEAEPIEGADGAIDAAAVDGAVDLGALDAGPDGARPDAADLGGAVDEGVAPDGGIDGGTDEGPPLDEGVEPDAGADRGVDAGPAADLGVDEGVEPDHGVDLGVDMGPLDLDWVEVACDDPGWMPGACVAGEGRQQDDFGGAHIAEDVPIEYETSPPATGPHRSRWGRWGEYSFMPPQRYLHNLEHGGIALLYHPCAPDEAVEALRAFARGRAEDETGPFRWVLTPYPGLDSAIAVAAWGWVYEAECVQAGEIGQFVDRFYRTAPEDVASDGAYDRGWLGR